MGAARGKSPDNGSRRTHMIAASHFGASGRVGVHPDGWTGACDHRRLHWWHESSGDS
jgi:hypothetical protein